jgi:hypothetical protein
MSKRLSLSEGVALILVAVTAVDVCTAGFDDQDEPTGVALKPNCAAPIPNNPDPSPSLPPARLDPRTLNLSVDTTNSIRQACGTSATVRRQPKPLPGKPELPHVEPTGMRAGNLPPESRPVLVRPRLMLITANNRSTRLPIKLRRACGQAVLAGRIR